MAPTSPPPAQPRSSRPVSGISSQLSYGDEQQQQFTTPRSHSMAHFAPTTPGSPMTAVGSPRPYSMPAPASPYGSAADGYYAAHSPQPNRLSAPHDLYASSRPPTRTTFASAPNSEKGGSQPGTPHPELYQAGGFGAAVSASQRLSGVPSTYRNAPSPTKEYGLLGHDGKVGGKRRGGGGPLAWAKRRPVLATLLGLLVLAVVGVGLGVGLSKGLNTSSSGTTSNALAGNPSSSSSTKGSATSSGSAAAPSASAVTLDSSGNDPSKITPLPFWDFTNPNNKVIGVSLGNWLALERWIDEDWFVGAAGPNTWDEWGFWQNAGPNVDQIMEQHFSTWVQESDLDKLQSVGVNHIRIPVGFWAFIPTEGDEPYRNTTQLNHLEQMLGWMWKRGLRALIDLHGMPGSQSGDQASGRNISGGGSWFNSTNQARSDVLIDTVINWIKTSPYSSVVAGVAPVNEPCGPNNGNPEKWGIVQDFYQRSYNKLQPAGLPSFMHHAFVADPPAYWASFFSTLDPRYANLNNNPYPAYFVNPLPSPSDALADVCAIANSYNGFPAPVLATEYSLASGTYDNSWETSFYNTQASAYSWSAGAYFWTFKTMQSSNRVLAAPPQVQSQYNFTGLIDSGVIPQIQQGQSTLQYLQNLQNPSCGPMQTQTYSTS